MRHFLGFLFLLSIVFLQTNCSNNQNVAPQSDSTLAAFKDNIEPCIALLSDGLRDIYTTKDSVSFFKDSKHYFSSEEFVNDYHNDKWAGGISVIIDGIPIGLDANASDEDLYTFQKKVREASSVVVEVTTYSTMTRSTLNIELANKFNECIENSQKFGLSIKASGEKVATITIAYKTLSSADPRPTVQSVELEGVEDSDRTLILQQKLKPGTLLPDQLSLTARRKAKEEMIIAINTSNGLSIVKRLEPSEIADNAAAPIGTVIASMLNFEQFSRLTNSNATSPSGRWSFKSMWAPCDGRSVQGSKYHIFAAPYGDHVPDLRGTFVRGLNQFDPQEPSTVNSDQANPEPKKPGTYQADEIKSHRHSISESQGLLYYTGGFLKGGVSADFIGAIEVPGKGAKAAIKTDEYRGSGETRPKNVSIYYYIRIN